MEKKYKIGYVPGSFDLFHVGHLNLLMRAKERCEYLIAGVCSDELIEKYKGRKPYINWNDRQRIVAAIRYVDQVVKVDENNTDKIAAWKMYHYNCHFAGSDHENLWMEERKFLHSQGVEMEFFPYTTDISTTQIRKELDEKQ